MGKVIIAYFSAILAVSIVFYAIGFLYDGIKNGNWSFNYDSGSIAKKLGFTMAVCEIVAVAFLCIFFLIYSWL